jgi:nitrite reductase (NADH) small subunit
LELEVKGFSMSDWHKLTAIDDVPPGTAKEFTVAGRIVALFHDAEQFHAIDGICAHQGGPLAKGTLTNGVITCPWHGWQFQIANGQHCLNPRICQTVFEVKIESGDVFVRI